MNERDLQALEIFQQVYSYIVIKAEEDPFCHRLVRGTVRIFSYKGYLAQVARELNIVFTDELVLIKTKNLLKAQISQNFDELIKKLLEGMQQIDPEAYAHYCIGVGPDSRSYQRFISAFDDLEAPKYRDLDEQEIKIISDRLFELSIDNKWRTAEEIIDNTKLLYPDLYRRLKLGIADINCIDRIKSEEEKIMRMATDQIGRSLYGQAWDTSYMSYAIFECIRSKVRFNYIDINDSIFRRMKCTEEYQDLQDAILSDSAFIYSKEFLQLMADRLEKWWGDKVSDSIEYRRVRSLLDSWDGAKNNGNLSDQNRIGEGSEKRKGSHGSIFMLVDKTQRQMKLGLKAEELKRFAYNIEYTVFRKERGDIVLNF